MGVYSCICSESDEGYEEEEEAAEAPNPLLTDLGEKERRLRKDAQLFLQRVCLYDILMLLHTTAH